MRASKPIVVTALLYAAYMTAKCPCSSLMGCHKYDYILPVAGASAVIAYGWGVWR